MSMRSLFLLALTLAPFAAHAGPRTEKAPAQTFEALCLAFTWSEDGRIEPTILLEGTKIILTVGERKEILRTPYAIFQAVVSDQSPNTVALDVLNLDGVRFAAASNQMTVGPLVTGAPGMHTHYQCEKWEDPARGKAGK